MTRTPKPDLGTATCSLRDPLVAGSHQCCVLTYTAGATGIDDSGSVKVVMREVTDADVPQFDDPAAPNYTTAAASNGAQLQLSYDVKGSVRPWSKTIRIKVGQGYLRRGDRITLTLGDRSSGAPGWRIQTFCEDTFELRVLVDRYATCVYEALDRSPVFRIVAGEPVELVAVAPTAVRPGEPIAIRTRLEDCWGNPVGRPRRRLHRPLRALGFHTIRIKDPRTQLAAQTNPILVRDGQRFGRFWADLHGQSEETVGTNTIEDYFGFARDMAFLDVCAHQGNDFQITDRFWRKIQQTTRQFYRPGRFVTFPGWEWSGNTGVGGDRNVLFETEGGIISRSSRALVTGTEARTTCSDSAGSLFDRLSRCGRNVMVFAHVGGRYADLAMHREGLETAVEVHSAWGTFPWMLGEAFDRGYRVAIVANSDGHKCRPGASHPGASTFGSYGGLTCVLAERLDRASIWEAYQARRVYATTGARIFVDVKTDGGQLMGSVVKISRHVVPTFHLALCGTAPIECVQWRNGTKVLKTVRPYGAADLANRVKVLWEGAQVRGRGRQVTWNGSLQVRGNRIVGLRPINFHNLEKRCRQTGPTSVTWESMTTGGVAGLILELQKPAVGTLTVTTAQNQFRAAIRSLGVAGRSYDLGGVGKRISVYRLGPAGGPAELASTFTPAPKDLVKGDNPIFVWVSQEDGHMAWSSPIYLRGLS